MTPKLLAPILALAAPLGGGALLYVAVLAQQGPEQGVSFSLATLGLISVVVLGLIGAITALYRAHLADDVRRAKDGNEATEHLLVAKDAQITALTNQIAAQTAANQEKDREIAAHAGQVIELLSGTVAAATKSSEGQTAMLAALRETGLAAMQAGSSEHRAILEALQQVGGALEFQRDWDGETERRKGSR